MWILILIVTGSYPNYNMAITTTSIEFSGEKACTEAVTKMMMTNHGLKVDTINGTCVKK
jgi:hypothetical protein